MYSFAADYYITVFAAAVGVIQVAASLGQLKGLLILKSPLIARTAGLALAAGAFVWFFASGARNINDYEGGLDGNEQAVYLFLGVLTAVAATFLVSSVVNVRLNGGDATPDQGLDALKQTTYARALSRSVRYWWREWRTQMKPYFFG